MDATVDVRDVEVRHDGRRARLGRSPRYDQSQATRFFHAPPLLPSPAASHTDAAPSYPPIPSSLPVGDIAPREGIPKAEKRRLEAVRPSRILPGACY